MNLPPSYSFTIVNVGEETNDVAPSPAATPRVRQRLPAPRSPSSAITSPAARRLPSASPKCSVISADVVLNLIIYLKKPHRIVTEHHTPFFIRQIHLRKSFKLIVNVPHRIVCTEKHSVRTIFPHKFSRPARLKRIQARRTVDV